jgi:hypothetical protein
MTLLLKIARWDDLYENSRTRDMKRMQWVPVPCKFDGDGYIELVTRHKNGPGHYAAWMALLLAAARCDPRGTMLRSNGTPHDMATISAMTKIPKSLLEEALPRIIEIGWIVTETTSGAQDDCVNPTVCPQASHSLPANSRARAPASVLSFHSVLFFQGRGVRGEGTELPEVLDTDDFRQRLDAWLTYKHEKREDYKPTGFQQMLTHAANMATRHGLSAITDAMTRAMANGWKGWDQDSIFKPDGKAPLGPAPKRKYYTADKGFGQEIT